MLTFAAGADLFAAGLAANKSSSSSSSPKASELDVVVTPATLTFVGEEALSEEEGGNLFSWNIHNRYDVK